MAVPLQKLGRQPQVTSSCLAKGQGRHVSLAGARNGNWDGTGLRVQGGESDHAGNDWDCCGFTRQLGICDILLGQAGAEFCTVKVFTMCYDSGVSCSPRYVVLVKLAVLQGKLQDIQRSRDRGWGDWQGELKRRQPLTLQEIGLYWGESLTNLVINSEIFGD